MHVTFYNNSKIKTSSTLSKIGKAELFLDYLEQFIANSATKRVHGFGTVGLAYNTIRTYNRYFVL